jgi:hypothetical protein
MRPKLQKQSALKLSGRIIPLSGGCNTPKLALGYYTRDSIIPIQLLLPDHKWMEILEAVAVTKKSVTQMYPT